MADKADPSWEIYGGDVGTKISEYRGTIDEVLDFCGLLLYANRLFQLLFLRIRHTEKGGDEYLGNEFCDDLKDNTKWVMRVKAESEFREWRLCHTHDLFARLYGELHTGATHIEIRHISNVCER